MLLRKRKTYYIYNVKETNIKSTSRKAMNYRGIECLNCGHPLDLTDRYCAYCGQLNTTKRLSLLDFINEFVLSVFTYDSRFRFTLKDLLFKPGTITKNYVTGKRIKYANPFRFFLSASILYFLLIAAISLFKDSNEISFEENKMNINGEEIVISDINQDSIPEVNLSPLKEIEHLHQSSEDLTALEKEINDAIKEGVANRKNKEEEKSTYTYKPEENFKKRNFIDETIAKGVFFNKFYDATGIKNPTKALDSLHYEKSKINLWLYSKNKDIDRVKENPIAFTNYLASKTPFFMFFFAPFFALFFWAIYSKKRANYMEHLVFIFHIFSWIFIVLLITLPIEFIFNTDGIIATILVTLVGPFYFYKALRNFYKQRRLITLIKFVFLNFIFFIGTSIFAIFFFAITAILF